MFKKTLSFFLKTKILSVTCILYGLIFIYDFCFGGNAGLIENVYFHRLFFRILTVIVLFYLVYYLTQHKNWLIKTISYNVLFGIAFLFIFEILAYVYVSFINTSIVNRPSHVLWYDNPTKRPYLTEKPLYYGDMDENFGRWRLPNVKLDLNRCSDHKSITYESNSMGFRDKERPAQGKKRIAVLGDSFMDGLWVDTEYRLSDLLEKRTNVAHLNAAINGANPLVYSLIYKKKVLPQLEHYALIVGIFVGNDFESYKVTNFGDFINYPLYKPYLGQSSDGKTDKIEYTLNNAGQSFESHAVLKNPKILRNTRDSLFSSLAFYKKIWVELQTNSYLLNLILHKSKQMASARQESTFESFYSKAVLGSPETSEFENSLKNIISLAQNRKVIFVLIPYLKDIVAVKKSKKHALKKQLDSLYATKNIAFIDLLPAFVSYNKNPADLYITCDGHWNEAGHKFAAEVILKDAAYTNMINSISVK